MTGSWLALFLLIVGAMIGFGVGWMGYRGLHEDERGNRGLAFLLFVLLIVGLYVASVVTAIAARVD